MDWKKKKTTCYRSIWISDVHLGVRDCKAEFLTEFLQSTECERLYLVGDFIDFEKMYTRRWWPKSHGRVLQTILSKSAKGTRVIYIPGNHDEVARDYIGLALGSIEIAREYIHQTGDGRRLLIIHGDEFDGMIRYGWLLNWIGGRTYECLLWVSRFVDAIRRGFGLPYWSLAAYLKHRVGKATAYIARFESAAAHEAARRGLDGVVCGHIHKPAITRIKGVLYCNDGDWVENCTAIVEHTDGSLAVLHWAEEGIAALHEPVAKPAVARISGGSGSVKAPVVARRAEAAGKVAAR